MTIWVFLTAQAVNGEVVMAGNSDIFLFFLLSNCIVSNWRGLATFTHTAPAHSCFLASFSTTRLLPLMISCLLEPPPLSSLSALNRVGAPYSH